ncbi:hypothetical protein CMI47_04405 [Candidatus Pacearchaeota archaeon]|jgi:hypothetical protein|nr:hypothetical protein [Candidatus Pacearchaeota archaeon]
MSKSSQKPESAGSGYGTDTPKNSQSIVSQGKPGHKAPALGSVSVVPDRKSPEQSRGGKN